MPFSNLLKIHHPIFNQPAKGVTIVNDEIKSIIQHMKDEIINIQSQGVNIVGLAANQIGYDKRIIVLNTPNYPLEVMINPVIEGEIGEQIVEEGCGSIDGIMCKVVRPKKVLVWYGAMIMDKRYSEEISFDGIDSAIVCHEVDHLDGVFITDKAIKVKSVGDKL